MRPFLKHILLFSTTGILLYLPVVWVLGKTALPSNVKYIPANYGMMDLRLDEADKILKNGDIDILFIGSSHCYRTFDTRIVADAGISCFNLGSSNQTPRQSFALLKRYVSHKKPKLVIFEIHPDIMEIDGDESSIDILSNTYIDAPIRNMVLSQHRLPAINTMCCSYIDHTFSSSHASWSGDTVRNVTTSSGDTTVNVDFAYCRGGYVEVTPYCYKPTALKPKTISVNKQQLEWLDRCVTLLKQNEIEILLVEVPSTRNRYLSYTNHRDFELQIYDIATFQSRTYPACKYLNLNDDTSLVAQLDDTTCFFDDDHFNQKGAEIVTKHILKLIANKYKSICSSLD